MEIKETYHGYEVRFSYNPDLIDQIKTIPGREYNPSEKKWFIPRASHQHLYEWANKHGLNMAHLAEAKAIGEPDPLPELTIDIPLKKDLFKYQRQGIAYCLKHPRTMIGDQPGLGKSAQAIAAITAQRAFPALVICPATLKENWVREWAMWTDKKAMVLSDRTKSTFNLYWETGMIDVFIVNYESLQKYFVKGIKTEDGKKMQLKDIVFKDIISIFKSVIVDESHRARNEETKLCKFCIGITNGKQIIYALTGTPMVNKPKDLRAQLRIIQQLDAFGGYRGFVDRYCAGYNEASNLKELNYLLRQTCFFQRKKSDVLKDLPDKIRSIMKVAITNKDEYRLEERRFEEFIEENTDEQGNIAKSQKGAAGFLIMKLKYLAAKGKIDSVVEYAQEVIESGEKLVIVVHHQEIVDELKIRLRGAVTVQGRDTAEQKQRNIDRFQDIESVNVIIITLAGREGITLTAASRIAFLEFPWTGADADQFEDRCHRYGQKDSVQATYFQGIGTVDGHCYAIIEHKRKLGGEVTGNEDETQSSIVEDFIKLFKNRKNDDDGNGNATSQI